jgi:hypothetical protein
MIKTSLECMICYEIWEEKSFARNHQRKNSLVTIGDKNKLRMHDLLRDMGREIVRGKSLKETKEHDNKDNVVQCIIQAPMT